MWFACKVPIIVLVVHFPVKTKWPGRRWYVICHLAAREMFISEIWGVSITWECPPSLVEGPGEIWSYRAWLGKEGGGSRFQTSTHRHCWFRHDDDLNHINSRGSKYWKCLTSTIKCLFWFKYQMPCWANCGGFIRWIKLGCKTSRRKH